MGEEGRFIDKSDKQLHDNAREPLNSIFLIKKQMEELLTLHFASIKPIAKNSLALLYIHVYNLGFINKYPQR